MTDNYARTDRDCLLRLKKIQAELEHYADAYDKEGARFPAWPEIDEARIAIKDAIERAKRERPRLRDL